jgi:hypothetical protein
MAIRSKTAKGVTIVARLLATAALFTVLAPATRATAAATTQMSELQITIVRCPKDAAIRPTTEVFHVLTARNGYYGPALALKQTVIDSRSGAYDVLRFRVPSGRYRFRFHSPHCWNDPLLFLLPHQRRYAMAILSGRIVTMGASIAAGGTLPYAGLSVVMKSALGDDSPAVTVQGGAYYVDAVSPNRYILRIEGTLGSWADIPLDLSGVEWGASLVRNVSAKEYLSAATHPYPSPPLYYAPNRIVQAPGTIYGLSIRPEAALGKSHLKAMSR